MSGRFFTLTELPDLTLAKYSAEESGGIEDVLRQHQSFYRQLNRKGILFGESYHLIYLYNPNEQPGHRLSVCFYAEHPQKAPVCMGEFMCASPLSPYFRFQDMTPSVNPLFPWEAVLSKQDGFVNSSLSPAGGNQRRFYMVNPWKANEKARLMGLFRMMKMFNQPCAYMVSLFAVDLSERMPQAFSEQIRFMRDSARLAHGTRDENAEQCLRNYEKFFDSLRSNPHFRCRICAYALNRDVAEMLLDAAASEAVEEGSYQITSRQGQFFPLRPKAAPEDFTQNGVPAGMKAWNSLFLLKEAVSFCMFPTLYPGEVVELPKESAPVYEKNGLYLGKDQNDYDVYIPLDMLPKHALLAGVPGSGKTFSMLHLSSQLSGDFNIPILVLEPAKKEYRALVRNERLHTLIVFSPGGGGPFPLRINPFQFPAGMKLSEHITNLRQVFEGAFDLTPPMPELIDRGIEAVYRKHDWLPFEINDGSRPYPNMTELYNKLAELLDASDYAPEVKSNLKSCLQVRIGSLIKREMGNVFDVPKSTLSPEEWMDWHCVLELESLGADAANFLTLLLSTIVREMLRQNPHAAPDRPRHVMFFEEAHNLIGPTTVANAENGDAKVASTKFIVDMLAEVRALREAIIIADQLPTALAPQITKNTSLKLGHKITAMDDRELLASTMSADGVQLERMGTFLPGHALCIYDKIQKPFEVQISPYAGNPESPDNEEMYRILSRRESYRTAMQQDFQIMQEKYGGRREHLEKIYRRVKGYIEKLKHDIEYVKSLDENSEGFAWGVKEIEKRKEKVDNDIVALCRKWLEFTLEVSDYVRMNRLMFEPDGKKWALSEIGTLRRVLDDISFESPEERGWYQRIAREIRLLQA